MPIRLKPDGDMPFAGQRMFWGGFEPILDSAGQRSAQSERTSEPAWPRRASRPSRGESLGRAATVEQAPIKSGGKP